MRILVDQSGYDLLNLGDVAMLQACVSRLRAQWPGADIMAISYAPELLVDYCPGVTSIGRSIDRPVLRGMRGRYGWAWKAAGTYRHGHRATRAALAGWPRTAAQAVSAADLVVASGGGYLTDAFWRHAAGVFSVLSLAQRLRKPTAMVGQGVDFVRSPLVRAQARSVLPRLALLSLRESVTSPDAALALGADPASVRITGDEALELLPDRIPGHGDALGFNIRMAGYAGTRSFAPAAAALPALQAAEALGAPIVGLPISRYADSPDLDAIESAFGGLSCRAEVSLADLTTPEQLISATARCRAVVTGSYHAAVFALGLGIPAVCVTRTPYYDAKFKGLHALFPGLVTVVALDGPDLASRLRAAIIQAWGLPDNLRTAAQTAAAEQREAGRSAYRELGSAVDAGRRRITSGG